MGIQNFRNKASEELAAGVENSRTRRLIPLELHFQALKKLQIVRAAKQLSDLANYPGLRLEKLKGKRHDEYSIRINNQYRICFRWVGNNAADVEIEDYH